MSICASKKSLIVSAIGGNLTGKFWDDSEKVFIKLI